MATTLAKHLPSFTDKNPTWETTGLTQAAVVTEVGGSATFLKFINATNTANSAKTYIKGWDATTATTFSTEESVAPDLSLPVGALKTTDFYFVAGIEQWDNASNTAFFIATKTVGSANTSNEAQVSPDNNFNCNFGFSST